MGERRGTKALELWCRRITEGYPGVNVQNMTTSWKDGLAFCAMIHHFRPDLIDFNSLDKNNVYENNELAFKIAEQHLGIPALLDAEDMATCSVPDRLSILTYLSQFYQTFGGSSPSRLALSRTAETTEEKITSIPESPKEKAPLSVGVRRDSCAVCGLPIFLAEKLVLGRVAYHRTCFRCARCNNQLTLGNYYETEEGQYCCETCPDEELSSPTMQSSSKTSISSGSETYEIAEKISPGGSFNGEENAQATLDDHSTAKLKFDEPSVPDIIAQTSQLRLNFISNHLLSGRDAADVADPKFSINDQNGKEGRGASPSVQLEAQSSKNDDSCDDEESNKPFASAQLESRAGRNGRSSEDEDSSRGIGSHLKKEHSISEGLGSSGKKLTTVSCNNTVEKKPVDWTAKSNAVEEPLSDKPVNHVDTDSCVSLVQARLKLFEGAKDHVNKKENQGIEVFRPKAQYKERTLKDSKESRISSDARNTEKLVASVKPVESETVNSSNDALDSTSCTSDTIASQENAVKDNTENPDTQQTGNNAHSQKNNEREEGSEEQVSTTVTRKADDSPDVTSAVARKDYPEDLNPFKSDEEDADVNVTDVNVAQTTENSTNPFDITEAKEEELSQNKKEKVVIPKPAARNNLDGSGTMKSQSRTEVTTKRRLVAPEINLNPFWSDEDDLENDLESKGKVLDAKPVPKPRTTRNIQDLAINGSKSYQNLSNLNVSNSSLASLEAGSNLGAICRKKKPAPLPPNKKDQHVFAAPSPNTVSKTRKTKPAPPPPMQTSSPCNTSIDAVLSCEESPISKLKDGNTRHSMWEDEKVSKDVANRNRQSFTHTPSKDGLYDRSFVDKSTEGKWKRKKGPAPPCPMPLKRKIKVMSLKDVKLELDEIELQQQGLEKQGVRLEQLIRSKCETESKPDDVTLGTDVEELVLELFALVNEKNELFRRQAELMLLRRQQRLEEEHAEVEYQIRCLMSQQESMKTDFDKQREEALIKRLVEIVERRNEIVDCLEMDRRREIEEDRSIHKHMDLFAVKNKNETTNKDSNHSRKSKVKENKSKDKTKEKKLKKLLKKDIDKDIDESEIKLKRHKRKWF